jgi:hypothetical protein
MAKDLRMWPPALVASTLAVAICVGTAQASACTPGAQACPVVLRMKPGATTIEATGSVSGEQPDFYFTFAAKAGQTVLIRTVGGGLKTGPGIPITGPNDVQDAVFEDTPYVLPATGSYVIDLHANTMSEGPFGRFQITLTIK